MYHLHFQILPISLLPLQHTACFPHPTSRHSLFLTATSKHSQFSSKTLPVIHIPLPNTPYFPPKTLPVFHIPLPVTPYFSLALPVTPYFSLPLPDTPYFPPKILPVFHIPLPDTPYFSLALPVTPYFSLPLPNTPYFPPKHCLCSTAHVHTLPIPHCRWSKARPVFPGSVPSRARTCVLKPRMQTMKKKRMAHSGETGICDRASGYTTNTSPGPAPTVPSSHGQVMDGVDIGHMSVELGYKKVLGTCKIACIIISELHLSETRLVTSTFVVQNQPSYLHM